MARTLLAAAVASLALAAPAQADYGDDCAPLGSQVQTTVCHGADVVSRDAAAATADHGPAVAAHEASWTHDALAFQHALGDAVPLRNAQWVGTHNSFNSIAEMGPALSVMDSNQQLSLVDQLRVDVRSLELDVHWFPSPRGGGMAPVVCHAQEGAGCSAEKLLGETLRPIGAWLRAHRDQVLLLYLENQLRGEEGSNAAAAAIEAELGDLVHRPKGPAGTCVDLPGETTRADVLAAGRQVLIVSNCGAGAAWRSWSFGWSDHEETRPRNYSCHADFDQATHDRAIVRYFEDDTWLTSAASNTGAASRDDGIDAETAAEMIRCGVDLLGMDQLTADDARLDALVWSWAQGEDVGAGCAALRPADGRWTAERCATKRHFACRSASGFTLTAKRLRGDRPPAGCGAPRTGYENEQARAAADGRSVWLALPS
ncbi:MAG TPA: hypothetical protein VGW10_14185 [Solirubrobacteraceae bacterium]|nr:hypothetical protein [Solirubrobacteraceae bacterium]